MQKFNDSFFDMKQSLGDAWKELATGLTTGFGTAMAQMIVEGKKFSEVITEFWKSLASTVVQLIGQMIAKWVIFQTLSMATGGTGGFFNFGKNLLGFREGGAFLGSHPAISAADGVAITPSFGEGGIPAILHPNEIVSPIDKFFDLIKSVGGNVTVNVNAEGVSDPRLLSELLAVEIERKRRRP
jgi:hypothetical protein